MMDTFSLEQALTPITCAKCDKTQVPTFWSDYYLTPLWEGEGRVCEMCFSGLVRADAVADFIDPPYTPTVRGLTMPDSDGENHD